MCLILMNVLLMSLKMAFIRGKMWIKYEPDSNFSENALTKNYSGSESMI